MGSAVRSSSSPCRWGYPRIVVIGGIRDRDLVGEPFVLVTDLGDRPGDRIGLVLHAFVVRNGLGQRGGHHGHLHRVLRRLAVGPHSSDVLGQISEVGQIVVVDDSPDQSTVDAVVAVGSPNVSAIHRAGKGGRGSAVLEGVKRLRELGCTRVIEMDADFSHPPTQIPELLEAADRRGLDLLIASRYLGGSRIENWPVTRRVFSRCSNWLARATLRVPVRDYTNGYRVYSARAADLIVQECGRLGKGFISLSEILVNLYYRNMKVGEVPTRFVNRVRGESSVSVQEIEHAVVGLFKIWGLKRKLHASRRGLSH